MTLTQRRIIYLIFIAFFLITLPIIILYANGYKYNFKKNNLQKTGAIFLESKPKDVKVFLNNNEIKEKIPILIKNLTPSEYNLKIIKNGFTTWNKEIKVNEGQTTFLQYVRLFKNQEVPIILYKNKIKEFKYNDDKDIFVIYSTNKENEILTWFNVKNYKQKNILKTTDKIITFKLIENGKLIFIETENDYLLINPLDEIVYNLNNIIGVKKIKKLKINKYNGNYFYYINNDKLYSYNLINNKRKLLLPYEPIDYLIKNNILYYLNQNSLNRIFLNGLNLTTNETEKNILNLNNNGNYQILNINNNFFTIKNKDTLILFNKEDDKYKKLDNVLYNNWDEKYNELIYGNEHELWVLKPKEKKNNNLLLTRNTKKIGKAIWYPITTHIIYHTDDTIKIIENLATNRNIADILKIDNIKQLVVNNKGDKLYFIGQVNGDDGLFELRIQ